MLELNKIYNIDCLEGLKQLDDNSIDSIVTDPPYELGFMNKSWDRTGIAYNVELWRECLRVLKPGGHLLAFGGARTYHRMASAIEDAGFEIRDQIMWIYGSGFPKSLDISKAIDKMYGVKGKVVGKAKSGKTEVMQNLGQSGIKGGEYNITQPASEEARQWQGWGTALKPANEPICVARKPLSEKNVALNVLKWGTGGINIDGCRIPISEKLVFKHTDKTSRSSGIKGKISDIRNGQIWENVTGRFPANIILDEEAGKMLDEQTGNLSPATTQMRKPEHDSDRQLFNLSRPGGIKQSYGDRGGASRFFYCAKASRKERGEFNNHPTVKPIKLMEYLVTLVTPPNGIVLDPFAGSGSTLIACKNKNYRYIGFEKDDKYVEIANKRIEEELKSLDQ